MTTPNNPGGDGYNNYGQWGDQPQQPWQDQNQQYGQPGNYPAHSNSSSDTSFFKALFDLEFNHFVTIKFAKVIYLIILIIIGLGFVGGVIASIAMAASAASESNAAMGFLVFIMVFAGAIVISLLYLVMARVSLEFYVAGIRTAQNTGEIRDNMSQRNF